MTVGAYDIAFTNFRDDFGKSCTPPTQRAYVIEFARGSAMVKIHDVRWILNPAVGTRFVFVRVYKSIYLGIAFLGALKIPLLVLSVVSTAIRTVALPAISATFLNSRRSLLTDRANVHIVL
jgi:hypothetical protein